MYDDESSRKIEVTRYCCAVLACGESVVEVFLRGDVHWRVCSRVDRLPLVEAVSTGVYVPGWTGCALLYRAKLRCCTVTNPQRGLRSRDTVAQFWRVASQLFD